ncbi:CIC_collapsed_G0012400.mRNA.1.CDS.1 [Saccharomyces cerevisiae]|nr:CIC_collapsed_G0012400.mRNA.1.CDS.1 [Saccharomyces cerevisiae]
MVTIGSSSPGIISFLRSFCTDHLYSFTQIFPLVVHFFFRRLLKRDAFGTIKNIGSQTYINIYVVCIYYIYASTISEASLRSANTTLCLLCQERTIEIC